MSVPVLPTHSRQSWCSSQPTCSHSPAPPGLHVLHFGELRPTGCFEGSHRATYIAALPEAIRREPNTCIPCCLVVLLHGLISWQPCRVTCTYGHTEGALRKLSACVQLAWEGKRWLPYGSDQGQLGCDKFLECKVKQTRERITTERRIKTKQNQNGYN